MVSARSIRSEENIHKKCGQVNTEYSRKNNKQASSLRKDLGLDRYIRINN
jgi:hypothetical protein